MNEKYIYISRRHIEKKNTKRDVCITKWMICPYADLTDYDKQNSHNTFYLSNTEGNWKTNIHVAWIFYTEILQAGDVHCAYVPLWFEQVVTSVNIFSWLWMSNFWWYPLTRYIFFLCNSKCVHFFVGHYVIIKWLLVYF